MCKLINIEVLKRSKSWDAVYHSLGPFVCVVLFCLYENKYSYAYIGIAMVQLSAASVYLFKYVGLVYFTRYFDKPKPVTGINRLSLYVLMVSTQQ